MWVKISQRVGCLISCSSAYPFMWACICCKKHQWPTILLCYDMESQHFTPTSFGGYVSSSKFKTMFRLTRQILYRGTEVPLIHRDIGCPPKKIGFRNVVQLSLWGVWAVKIWVFWGAKHIWAMTRCLAHVPNVFMLIWTPIYPLTHIWMAISSKTLLFS